MTFEDLFQSLSTMTPEERAAHDLTIFDTNDQEFYKADLSLRRVVEDDQGDAEGEGKTDVLDLNHPYLLMNLR